MERSPWALKSFINPNPDVFLFRVSAFVFSVYFSVIPWLMLLLTFLNSVASLLPFLHSFNK
jgi:hypothetical protein